MDKPTKKKTKPRKKKSKGNHKLSGQQLGIILLAVLAFGLLVYFLYCRPSNKTTRELIDDKPSGFASFGIDVSHHQGMIEWDELLNNASYDSLIHFVYCKATEGTSFVDSQWLRNRKFLTRKRKFHGAYHFFSIKSDPLAQARHFLRNWTPGPLDLPPVLDIETEGLAKQELINRMTIWLEYVERKTGMRPIIYTSRHMFDNLFSDAFLNHKFWVAAYSSRPACLEDARVIHWQYSENGRLPGINENVDFNVSKLVFL